MFRLDWQTDLAGDAGQTKAGQESKGQWQQSFCGDRRRAAFCLLKSGTLVALNFDGEILWKINLQELYGKGSLFWDLGTSPVLADGNVVVAVMHEADSYMVALKQETGEIAWKIDRNFVCKMESGQSYTTPLVVRKENMTILVVWCADHLTGHDATTGETT